MPNLITPTGLEVATQAELLANFTAQFQAIYGADINLDPDSPDGQMINIFIQAILDVEDLIAQVYNGFDPDNAIGVVLDQRCAINGIQRQAGTFSTTDVTVTTNQGVTLSGLNQTVNPVYTVSDSAGTQWQLVNTSVIGGAGANVLLFQAANPGQVLSIPNTITVPVTIVLGVTAINNPSSQINIGLNEESDAALRIRRQKSVSLGSQGYLAGLYAALLNVTGLSFAFVEENNTGSTNADGVPGHSIWVIVAGSGTAADIANAIYTKRNAGCGIYSTGSGTSVSFTITQVDGSPFVVVWDTVVSQNLFIRFTLTSLDGVNAPNISLIRSQLPVLFKPGVAQQVNVNDLATLIQEIDPNSLVTSAGFSATSGGSYTNTLTPTNKYNQFSVTSPNTIIRPIMMTSPISLTSVISSVVTVTSTATASGAPQTFTAIGGFGSYTFSFATNNSGGSIGSSSGIYTPGVTGSVTDTIRVTDSQSQTFDVAITVT
jgi:hypothetical protein